MTETTERTAGTAVEQQVAPGALARVKGAKPWTIADLAEILARPVQKPEPAEDFIPEVPKPVAFTDKLRSALRAVPGVFGKVAPTERRKLEKAEVEGLVAELMALSMVSGPIGSRMKDITELLRHHMDFVAAEAGRGGKKIASGIGKGHVLAARPEDPFNIPVEGYDDPIQQRYVGGKPQVTGSKLEEMKASGTITQEQYLACTSAGRRSYDPDKMALYIRRHPEEGLRILAAMTTMGDPSGSLYPPKK